MKKRILSLILVVVMLALTLTGCSYSFANDDMSNYATFGDAEFNAFKQKLQSLSIEDGDFTTDEETRKQKIEESIYATVGSKADLNNKLYEGKLGIYDILYYAYYATANFEGEDNVVLYASNMKESSATKLQLGMLSGAGDLDKAINEALADKDIKDYLYKTDTSAETELKLGDVVYVSYTYEYVGEDGKAQTVKATYEKIILTEGDPLSEKLISEAKKVGVKKNFDITIDGVKRAYKNAVVDWVVKEENKLGEFAVKDFDETKSVNDVNGKSRKFADIKDDTLTYHVYPVYFVKIDDFTAEFVLDTILGANIYVDLFEMFSDNKYKTKVDGKEVKLSTLIEEFAALCKTRDSAKTSLDSAEKTLKTKQQVVDEAGDKATAAEKEALEIAKKAVNGDPNGKTEDEKKGAKKVFEEADKKVKDKIEVIFSTGDDVKEKIVSEYKDLVKENLESAYNNEIILNVAKELWALIKEVKVNSLPEKAVEETYKRIIENHEYTFYTGEDSSTKMSYYKKYNGSFNDYLIDTFAKGKTYEDALKAIREEAKEAVTPVVKLYAVAAKFECVVEDKEYNEDYVKNNYDYEQYVIQYGEMNLRTAYQFDKLLTTVLEVETYEEGCGADCEEDHDHIVKGEMKPYKDGKLPFKNIKYEIKTEEEETEG